MEQQSPGSAQKAKQGTDATGGERRELWWAEASIWTDRVVLALGRACPCEGALGRACPCEGARVSAHVMSSAY
jgi:hypothetical protein